MVVNSEDEEVGVEPMTAWNTALVTYDDSRIAAQTMENSIFWKMKSNRRVGKESTFTKYSVFDKRRELTT
ncbi:hypothetical protein KIN20_024210 [Parelaphostrongylus tenuis]|uniref:Uncharacterized protein n=1 Tax=Parelaphostrongylus tenuis TaxID=148309 RepID=A0AAD5QWL6_PARTN|nr:hypothetical protein KIN20_024210 [Parelaphostrongylus tenuis]